MGLTVCRAISVQWHEYFAPGLSGKIMRFDLSLLRRVVSLGVLVGLTAGAALAGPSNASTVAQVYAPASASYVRVADAGDSSLAEFSTPDEAQAHCPSDVVVWLNTASGVWHYVGERWYGNTRSGAYVCEKEAAAAGDRATRNGQ
jgi:hypothetical protein